MWTVTYTGKVGPAQTVTSLVLNNVTRVDYDWNEMVVSIYQGGTVTQGTLTGVTTVTTTVASKTIVIS